MTRPRCDVHFSSNKRLEFIPLLGLRGDGMAIDNMKNPYNTAVTDTWERTAQEIVLFHQVCSRLFREGVQSKKWMTQTDEKNAWKHAWGCRRQWKLLRRTRQVFSARKLKCIWTPPTPTPLKKARILHQRNRIDSQLSRTGLRNVLQKEKRFSADWKNIAKNYNHKSFGHYEILNCN